MCKESLEGSHWANVHSISSLLPLVILFKHGSFSLCDLNITFVSFLCVFIFVNRREKLSLREKKKRKKRVVTVGMYSSHENKSCCQIL